MNKKQARYGLSLVGATSIIMAMFIGGAIEQARPKVTAPARIDPDNIKPLSVKITPSGPITLYPVTRVVDGDTIDVDMAGTIERIRLIGINTPETVDTRRPVQCFGKEASAHMHELLDGKMVSLKKDSVTGDRDKYGRMLRYVYNEGDRDINAAQIEDGYAYEYTYHGQVYAHQAEYKKLAADARTHSKGLWSENTCNGKL